MRLRKDIKFTRQAAFSQPDDREQDILVDEAIELTGDATMKNYSNLLRRVVVYRPYDSSRRKSGQEEGLPAEPEQTIELITNNAYREADTYWNKQECSNVSDLDCHDSHIAAPISQKQG